MLKPKMSSSTLNAVIVWAEKTYILALAVSSIFFPIDQTS